MKLKIFSAMFLGIFSCGNYALAQAFQQNPVNDDPCYSSDPFLRQTIGCPCTAPASLSTNLWGQCSDGTSIAPYRKYPGGDHGECNYYCWVSPGNAEGIIVNRVRPFGSYSSTEAPEYDRNNPNWRNELGKPNCASSQDSGKLCMAPCDNVFQRYFRDNKCEMCETDAHCAFLNTATSTSKCLQDTAGDQINRCYSCSTVIGDKNASIKITFVFQSGTYSTTDDKKKYITDAASIEPFKYLTTSANKIVWQYAATEIPNKVIPSIKYDNFVWPDTLETTDVAKDEDYYNVRDKYANIVCPGTTVTVIVVTNPKLRSYGAYPNQGTGNPIIITSIEDQMNLGSYFSMIDHELGHSLCDLDDEYPLPDSTPKINTIPYDPANLEELESLVAGNNSFSTYGVPLRNFYEIKGIRKSGAAIPVGKARSNDRSLMNGFSQMFNIISCAGCLTKNSAFGSINAAVEVCDPSKRKAAPNGYNIWPGIKPQSWSVYIPPRIITTQSAITQDTASNETAVPSALLSDGNTVTLPQPIELPELQTLPLGQTLKTDPKGKALGVTVSSGIKNTGALAAGNFDVTWKIDGRIVTSGRIGNIAAGTELKDDPALSMLFTAAPGLHQIEFAVDPENTVREQNKENNAVKSVLVARGGGASKKEDRIVAVYDFKNIGQSTIKRKFNVLIDSTPNKRDGYVLGGKGCKGDKGKTPGGCEVNRDVQYVDLSSAGNKLSLKEGGISFWFKPIDQGGKPLSAIVFTESIPALRVSWKDNGELEACIDEQCLILIKDVKEGSWYHLALTWQNNILLGYINGKETFGKLIKPTTAPKKAITKLLFGTAVEHDLKLTQNKARFWLDEVKLYNRVLFKDDLGFQ